jgi:hypothetical protein
MQQRSPVQVVIQKPDLDTCLTGLILHITGYDLIQLVTEDAPDVLLNDPAVFCIEAGGSGDIKHNNFDHHDPLRQFPASCQQANSVYNSGDPAMDRLVEYVAMVDGCAPLVRRQAQRVYLSHLFSGLLQSIPSPVHQFLSGIRFLQEVLDRKLDPFGDMPLLDHWQGHYTTWLRNKQLVTQIVHNTEWFRTNNGRLAGYLANPVRGGFGHIYGAGAEIGILYNASFGPGGIAKYTLGSSMGEIGHLIDIFSWYETGWGGRSTILGSPYKGSCLAPEMVKDIVRKHC